MDEGYWFVLQAVLEVITMRHLWFLILLCVAASGGCTGDLMRYDDRALCLGYFQQPQGKQLLVADNRWGFPVDVRAAGLALSWQPVSETFTLFNNDDDTLYVIDLTGVLKAERDYHIPYRATDGIALNEASSLLAITYRPGGSTKSYTTDVYPFDVGATEKGERLVRIQGLELPVWHPSQPKLAGVYHTDATTLASNTIAVFDLSLIDQETKALHEVGDSNIYRTLNWSGDGRKIAIAQFLERGLMPVYLFPKEELTVDSVSSTFDLSCIHGGLWSPLAETIAFQGSGEMTDGWDIFLEEVADPAEESGPLVNLTQSTGIDETNASWSSDGTRLVFTSSFLDADGNEQQELYQVLLTKQFPEFIKLTNTSEEFETNPLWISDSDIAYLSWVPDEAAWYLKVLSIAELGNPPMSILELPASWYRAYD